MAVIKEFADKGKLMVGHCAAALMFEIAGVDKGRKLAVHPLAKPAILNGVATDDAFVADGNFYTAQCEHSVSLLMPELIEVLK